jgi:hypothetical protein
VIDKGVRDSPKTDDWDIDAFNTNGKGEGGIIAKVDTIFGGFHADVGAEVDELKAIIRGKIIMSVKNLHESRIEGAARTVKRWRMLEGLAAMVMVSIVEYNGVKSTEDGASAVGGCAGVVACVDDEELEEAQNLEVVVGQKGGGGVGKGGECASIRWRVRR